MIAPVIISDSTGEKMDIFDLKKWGCHWFTFATTVRSNIKSYLQKVIGTWHALQVGGSRIRLNLRRNFLIDNFGIKNLRNIAQTIFSIEYYCIPCSTKKLDKKKLSTLEINSLKHNADDQKSYKTLQK